RLVASFRSHFAPKIGHPAAGPRLAAGQGDRDERRGNEPGPANSPASGTERLALLAPADACSRDDGTGYWPSAATIARKANTSDRTVHGVIAGLEAKGQVVVVTSGQRPGRVAQRAHKAQAAFAEAEDSCAGVADRAAARGQRGALLSASVPVAPAEPAPPHQLHPPSRRPALRSRCPPPSDGTSALPRPRGSRAEPPARPTPQPAL